MAARRYCWTLNNPTDDERRRIRSIDGDNLVGYIICGNEVGQSGTPHLQGYLELKSPQRINRVKRILGVDRVHLEAARGTPTQAAEYCKKEGDTFHEAGAISRQGKRNDLLTLQESIDGGASVMDIAREHFGSFIKYGKGIRGYLALHVQPRDWRTQVVWWHGPTGTGKSRRAHTESQNLCPNSVCWLPDQTLTWFDGYEGHKGVIIDDFDGRAPIAQLLRLFDRYPLKVAIKGGFVEWVPRIIWVTSNKCPEDMYGDHHQWDALRRRIDEIDEIN
ncbi:replication-associated protein [Crucivirus-298]|nr:replication-associated protein [Crucivirus-298]